MVAAVLGRRLRVTGPARGGSRGSGMPCSPGGRVEKPAEACVGGPSHLGAGQALSGCREVAAVGRGSATAAQDVTAVDLSPIGVAEGDELPACHPLHKRMDHWTAER